MASKLCKLPVELCRFSSPVGSINVSSCPEGLHEMSMESNLSDEFNSWSMISKIGTPFESVLSRRGLGNMGDRTRK